VNQRGGDARRAFDDLPVVLEEGAVLDVEAPHELRAADQRQVRVPVVPVRGGEAPAEHFAGPVVDHHGAVEHPRQRVEHGGQPAMAGGVALQGLLQLKRAVGELGLVVSQQALDGPLDLGQHSAIRQHDHREVGRFGDLVRARHDRPAHGERAGPRLDELLDDGFEGERFLVVAQRRRGQQHQLAALDVREDGRARAQIADPIHRRIGVPRDQAAANG